MRDAPPKPSISGLSPTSVAQGTSGYFSIYGQGLANATVSTNCSGVSLSNSYDSAGQINEYYTVSSSAPTGSCTLTVSTSSGSASTSYSITQGPPSIASINPTQDTAGDSGNLAIYGQNLTPLSSVNISCSTISHSIAYSSATQINVTYTIASNAAASSCSVSVSTAYGTSNSATFNIVTSAPPPSISGMSPTSVAPGTSGYFSIYGQGLANATVSTNCSSVSLSNSYDSAGQINEYYTVSSGASAASCTLTVRTSSGSASTGFSIT